MDSYVQHVGSSSVTEDQTLVSCIENMESWPLDYQGSPKEDFLSLRLSAELTSVWVPMSMSQFAPLTTFPSHFLPYEYYSLHRYLLSLIMCLALF